jgi:membrane protein implicated in regulation of membrane protease activity
VRRPEDGPGALAWLIASISLALPWIGLGLGLTGIWQLSYGEIGGWWLVAGGAAILVADVLIDLVWAHPSVLRTDQPDLNRRAAQLVGRVLVVEEAIEGGRGKVRVGDTLWSAEGPDVPCGAEVRVTAAKATVLLVERLG